ncbi:hypothetical protein GW813_11870, partial [bacterium]|nr:hypothetical protein [bacterium]
MGASLGEQTDLGGEDLAVGDAVGPSSGGRFEQFAEASEFVEDFPDKAEATLGVDFF